MEGELTTTLQQAEREASASRFGVADRLLTDFALTHPNTREAIETGYWRALFALDPANQTSSPREALTLLDGYLTVSASIAHRGSAQSLRRAVAALDRPPASATGAAPQAPAAAAPARADAATDKSRDEEVQRLKEELAKANAELERIRKRVTQPNP
jgi:hypothetical protein